MASAALHLSAEDSALIDMLVRLKARGYRFVTISPESHARVLARPGREQARTIEDALGWNLDFPRDIVPSDIRNCLHRAVMIDRVGTLWRSRLRVSSLAGELFLHAPYPPGGEDDVFFGPDSYRFAAVVAEVLARGEAPPPRRIADVGTGAGVGGIVAARLCPEAEVVMTDINGTALHCARINAAAAGLAVSPVETSGLEQVDGRFDLVTISPPIVVENAGAAASTGHGERGARLALELTAEAIDRLAPAGRLILYTGSAISAGRDRLEATLAQLAAAHGATMVYREIDPDACGEVLGRGDYREVDRIARVAAVITAAA
jgi:hypothetical protein